MSRVILVVWLIIYCNPATAGPSIWFAPLSSLTAEGIGAKDYMKLFDDDEYWQGALSQVKIFKLYPYFMGRAPDSDLRKIFASLRRHGISLALEARALTDVKSCQMSGGDGGQSTIRLLQRIERLGGRLDILAMDEPLKHGLKGERGCRANISQIVEDLAKNIHQFRQIFPSLKVGDIEPIGDWQDAPNQLSDTLAFVQEYHHVMGERLAFLHADVGWNTHWLPILMRLGEALRTEQVRFGVIYNGTDLAASDEAWARQAVEHFRVFESCGRAGPDDVIFQTWRSHPTRVLPENDPTTLSGILATYLSKKDCIKHQSKF